MKCRLRKLGTVITKLRLDQRLSLADLSAKSGVSAGNLCKIENGANLTVNSLVAIAKALRVTPGSLLNVSAPTVTHAIVRDCV